MCDHSITILLSNQNWTGWRFVFNLFSVCRQIFPVLFLVVKILAIVNKRTSRKRAAVGVKWVSGCLLYLHYILSNFMFHGFFFPANTECYVSLSLRSATAWSRVTTVVSSHEGGSPFCNVTSPTGGQHGSAASSFSISLYLFLGILFLRIAFPQRFKAELGTIKDYKNNYKTYLYQLFRVHLYSSLFSTDILGYEICFDGIAVDI